MDHVPYWRLLPVLRSQTAAQLQPPRRLPYMRLSALPLLVAEQAVVAARCDRVEHVWAPPVPSQGPRLIPTTQVRAARFRPGTVALVTALFERRIAGKMTRMWVPPAVEVICFLRRRTDLFDTDRGDDIVYGDDLDPFDDVDVSFSIQEQIEADIDALLEDDVPDEELLFELAGLFGIHRFSEIWWRSGDAHDEDCSCAPVTLLEVLQTLDTPADRQAALDIHLGVLHHAWDHYWSGDALIRSDGSSIGAACASCIGDGHTHLASLLDEARAVAEDLGEALAAFDSSIAIGIDRYHGVADDL